MKGKNTKNLRELSETNVTKNTISKNKNQKFSVKGKNTNILKKLPDTNIPKKKFKNHKPEIFYERQIQK